MMMRQWAGWRRAEAEAGGYMAGCLYSGFSILRKSELLRIAYFHIREDWWFVNGKDRRGDGRRENGEKLAEKPAEKHSSSDVVWSRNVVEVMIDSDDVLMCQRFCHCPKYV
jgi:hypothetical protein